MSDPIREDETRSQKASWLMRQWQRLRALPWRDVIITQIGDDAQNVAVGKYIFQFNVGGRNLAIPIVWIALALFFFVGLTAAYLTQGYWNPTQMRGDLNIAIADFGVVAANGTIQASAFGADLSQSVFDQLTSEYAAAKNTGAFTQDVKLWHDSLGQAVKNVTLGVMTGRTETRRAASAAALAQRINADVVLYGYLSADEKPEGLVVQFFINSSTVSNEPDTIIGRHRLGAAIGSAVPFTLDATLAKASMQQPLADRTKAIFWLLLALTHSFVNNHDQALTVLQQAEIQLQQWKRTEGKEVLYYFLGREALWLHRFDLAIPALEEALEINPTYVNALAGLAGVYYDRAQLFFLRGRQLPAELQQCVVAGEYDQGAATLDDALADIQTALDKYRQAVKLAPTSSSPMAVELTQMGLGLAYQLQGQALIWANDLAGADQALDLARTTLQFPLAAFNAEERTDYLARTQQGVAVTDRLQAHIRLVHKSNAINAKDDQQAKTEQTAGIALLRQALTNVDACLAQREKLLAKPIFVKYVLECGCKPLAQDTRMALENEGVTP